MTDPTTDAMADGARAAPLATAPTAGPTASPSPGPVRRPGAVPTAVPTATPPEPATGQAGVPTTRRPVIVGSVMLAMFLSAIEISIVATAAPSIVSKLGGFAELTWVFSAFMLAQAATIPIYGRLADLYGRRPVFAAGTGLFIVGSFLCGTSASMSQLILFRVVQGLGAGAIQPVASTIIGDIFTMEERARMQGWLSSVWAVAALIGPLVGGFIVERLHWAWIFWLNVPLAPLAIAGVSLCLREPAVRRRHSVDYAGAVLLASGVSLLLFALLQGGVAWAWTSAQSVSLLAGALVVLAGFVVRELRAPEPILPLGLFRNRVVSVADAGFLLVGGMSPTVTTFVSLFVQGVIGASATVAGLTLIPMSIGWPLASAFAGRVILRTGFRWTAILGAGLTVVGGGLLVVGAGSSSIAWIGVAILVLGAGLGFLTTTLIVALQGSVPWSTRGVATASSMFTRQLGSTVGIALLGSIMNAALLSRVAALPAEVQAAAGDGLGVGKVLLDAQARAALDPEVVLQLTATLASSIQAVFVGVLATALVVVVVACLLPDGVAQKEEGYAP
jgi:EmrB/QacA subfamily drug resistance transporter